MSPGLRYVARSDVGLVRGNNEDSVYAGARLLALADGMGGHAAGEVASQLAIAALAHLDDDEPGGDLLSKLNVAVREGNAAIAAHIEADPELEGMGTTLTAILFEGNRLGLAHIGDSRAYLMRDGELTQITKDDTFVQTLVDEGRITREEAHSHPQRSLIMRALTGHEVEPTLTMREAQVGDRYLLCSDGLSDPVTDETIEEALRIPDVAASADRLIELALRGGGPDNVTVVVAEVVDNDHTQTQPILAGAVSGSDSRGTTVPNTAAGRAFAITPRKEPPAGPPTDAAPPPRRPPRRMLLIAAVALLVLVAALGIGWAWTRTNYYVAAHNGQVWIMRGMPGIPSHRPYLWACVSTTHRVSTFPADNAQNVEGCQPMQLTALCESARNSVEAGLPVGTLDKAKAKLDDLARDSLLPRCAGSTPQPTSTTSHPPTPSSEVPHHSPDTNPGPDNQPGPRRSGAQTPEEPPAHSQTSAAAPPA